jgi:hypothetical protein
MGLMGRRGAGSAPPLAPTYVRPQSALDIRSVSAGDRSTAAGAGLGERPKGDEGASPSRSRGPAAGCGSSWSAWATQPDGPYPMAERSARQSAMAAAVGRLATSSLASSSPALSARRGRTGRQGCCCCCCCSVSGNAASTLLTRSLRAPHPLTAGGAAARAQTPGPAPPRLCRPLSRQ